MPLPLDVATFLTALGTLVLWSTVRATPGQAGFDLAGAVLADGSGLSTTNRLSPALLGDILLAAAGNTGSPGQGAAGGVAGRGLRRDADRALR